ncbi:GapA-binding peptide SR1P [Paenibacillus faecalis]|uniref:GapA-binding peptide SR1P n=1 Tax=Paenibacillus faecalis TaxID=2079532 RepID=UPI001F32058C|nr:GapA-binding peptide SR1P [Paenibacillus faecalis]
MANSRGSLMLGVILCDQCDKVLEEVDTEKVIIYYNRCDECAASIKFDESGVKGNEIELD